MIATKPALAQQLQRPEGRAEFERLRKECRATLADGPFEGRANGVLELGAALDAGVSRFKRELLGSALCWNEENERLTQWIHQQHRQVADMVLPLVAELRRADGDDPLLVRLAAAALFHWGEGAKWAFCRERPSYEPLHDLILMARAAQRHEEPIAWVADGRGRTATVESLYFRALLLDRFASGSLTRQQVEVLDAWMWEWGPALRGVREHPGTAALRVDLDSNTGLREGRREEPGPALYLPLGPLEEQRRRIVREMHRGRMVPAHGAASEFRIEEHIGLLDHLARAFRFPEGEAPQRAPRQSASGARIEVWVGLAEVLSRGIGVGSETGRYRALDLGDPSIDLHARKRYAESQKRYLWIADASASGYGFEALESDAAGIEVGDLLGWRRAPGTPIVLGQVIRRLPSATSGQVFLGVRLLTESSQALRLSQVIAFDNGAADGTYLFVPGDDDSGRHDAFLVSESTYELRATYRAHVGSASYTLKFNRVRRKGRGWLLAGFEIVPEKAPEPLRMADGENEPLRPLEFSFDESAIDRAFERELSPRML